MNEKETRSPQGILREPYARILVPGEDGTYTAEILEFPGCYAEGDTAQEAITNLESAASSWIEAALEQGQEIPSPIAAHGYSGKTHLRLAKSIHKQAARFAERDGVSLNQFFSTAIAARVGADEFYERLARRLQALATPTITFVNVQTSFNYGLMVPTDKLGPLLQYKQTEDVLPVPFSAMQPARVSPNA